MKAQLHVLILHIVVTLSALISGVLSQECNIEGRCQGNNLDFKSTNTPEQCLEFCQEDARCNYFTHDSAQRFCFTFDTCGEVDTTCTTCISGERDCQPIQCFITGECKGSMAGYTTTISQEACLLDCQAEPDCAWFSYHFSEKLCKLMRDCQLDTTETRFLSGARECSFRHANFPKLFLQHGSNTTWINKPQVSSGFETGSPRCSQTPDYPLNVTAAAETILNGQIVICGGVPSTTSCFGLNTNFNLWIELKPLPEPRWRAASIMTEEGWWIAGGAQGSNYLNSSILYNSTSQTWSEGPDMPFTREGFCVAQINNAMSFVAGGYGSDGPLRDAWTYSWPDDLWVQMPNMINARWGFGCTVVVNDNGVKGILVAGGNIYNVEFFYLNTMTWTRLPQIPDSASLGPVFVHDGDNLFLVSSYYNRIMHFDKTRLSFNTIPGQGTGITGAYASVLPITDDLLHNC